MSVNFPELNTGIWDLSACRLDGMQTPFPSSRARSTWQPKHAGPAHPASPHPPGLRWTMWRDREEGTGAWAEGVELDEEKDLPVPGGECMLPGES